MPLSVSGLSPAQLHLSLAEKPRTSVPQDITVSSHLNKGSALRLTGSWLNPQKVRFTSAQLQLLDVVLGALDGREAVSDISQDELGGHFALARPCYGASNIHYQREGSAPDTVGFLSINDKQGKPLLTLGHPRSAATADSADAGEVACRADETSILAHSRRDPDATWQNALYIVPFLTSQGEKAKVVGNYVKGDSLRFEVKNKDGNSYAVLKRTQLEKGEPVWMLSQNASLAGGNGSIPYSITHGQNQGVQCHLNISSGRDASIENFIKKMLGNLRSKPTSDPRATDAVGILRLVKDDHNHSNNFHFMTCSQGQKPIGLMVVERMDRKEVYIHHVVADSDYPGTAKAMMQQAASMAIAHSQHGKLTVSPLNASVADNFERNYGFASNNDDSDDDFDDEDDLVLKPAQSELWQCKVGGEAKLKSA
ncbi:hypothetical protein [Erwinia oleae]|uniref:hypothetical protein n=1 Tax=Erwinia oleae TaxID=796334 RepID=UPI00055224C6|nr:hypothetical protein [Erwinia oleae]